jgi:predicted RecA/RadA family phage recombinase
VAKNLIFEDFDELNVQVTQPASPVSGDPVLFGDRAGLALTTMDGDGRTTVQFEGVAEVSVKGVDGSGNSAVKAGDVIYYVVGDTPVLSKKATGARWGVAMSRPTDAAGGTLVAAGATATIRVYFGL